MCARRVLEQVLEQGGVSLVQLFAVNDLCAVACVGRTWREFAYARADWESHCTQRFGSACAQYVAYLNFGRSQLSVDWRDLYTRLARFHRQLARGEFAEIDWASAVHIVNLAKQTDSGIAESTPSVKLVQGGHEVLFCGDEQEVRVVGCTPGLHQGTRCFSPFGFLDVAPVGPVDILGVARSDCGVCLEHWRLRCTADHENDAFGASTAGCVRRCLLGRPTSDGKSAADDMSVAEATSVRIFIEHVAALAFVFVGDLVFAQDLVSLEPRYRIFHRDAGVEDSSGNLVGRGREEDEEDVELLARWDYGRAFITYHQDGDGVSAWESATGHSLGAVRAKFKLLSCDLSWHSKLNRQTIATLEIDGQIRLYSRPANYSGAEGVEAWRHFGTIPPISLQSTMYVEVKLEGRLLLAVSQSEDGACGSVHVWDIVENRITNPRRRLFESLPDRVEARHGGAFIEVAQVCFAPRQRTTSNLDVCAAGFDGSCAPAAIKLSALAWPEGVFDVRWLDANDKSLRVVLAADAALGDWRCDVRDRVAKMDDNMCNLHVVQLW